ncbi:phosphoglycolate phosphatase [Succinivibrio dextrinosolvens]|uniref:HAD family hydrolase n=1 Tax=Succinivibrio dextrinosolvens TaxID=83771 RepID=UPI0008F2110E|nr:HAD-IA family hydrolase [Succinivibrio dextrinosolvens]SFS79792.1 phosphoglycolate phosphatase [Succinivibrio dextrinosolvens]
MNTKYKAILFDLDGTLLDTAPDLIEACNYTLSKFGYKKLDEKIIRTKVTAGMREMLRLGVPEKEWDSAGIETVMRDCFASYYTEHICDRTKDFSGIETLIEELHKNGVKTAVITNKYYVMAKKVLSKFEFSKNFELILGCDSLTHTKPHPEPILKALELLDTAPEDALYVGDHLNDIKAAIASNTDSVAVLWGYGQNECPDIDSWGATYKAEDVAHLKSLIFC